MHFSLCWKFPLFYRRLTRAYFSRESLFIAFRNFFVATNVTVVVPYSKQFSLRASKIAIVFFHIWFARSLRVFVHSRKSTCRLIREVEVNSSQFLSSFSTIGKLAGRRNEYSWKNGILTILPCSVIQFWGVAFIIIFFPVKTKDFMQTLRKKTSPCKCKYSYWNGVVSASVQFHG